MFYMLQVFLVVSIPIFVLAGTVLLSMIAWTALRDYVRAHIVMRPVTTQISSRPRRAKFIRAT